MAANRQSLGTLVINNSMSLALFGLFAASITGQAVSGWVAYNSSLDAAHLARIGFAAYLGTGNFLDGAMSNWQAAILQLTMLVALGSVLRQKGAAHSRQPVPDDGPAEPPEPPTPTSDWLYAHSLSLAFVAMFVMAFALHLVFGRWKYNVDQALQHLPVMALPAYAASSSFWFSVFQCWEAEFGILAIYVVFSIFPAAGRVARIEAGRGEQRADRAPQRIAAGLALPCGGGVDAVAPVQNRRGSGPGSRDECLSNGK